MNEARARRQGEYGAANKLPPGVSVKELSPLFDFSRKPWLLLQSTLRQLTVAWTVLRYTQSNSSWSTRTTGREWALLDAACGYGELYTLLRDAHKTKGAVFNYIGVDLDPEKLAVARLLRKAIDVRELNVLAIENLPEAPFDVVVSSETLEHLERPQGLRFIDSIRKVLNPAGLLIMTVPTPLGSIRAKRPFHLYEWHELELLTELKLIGFDILDYYQLFTHANNWSISTRKRIPQDIMRLPASAMLVDVEGTCTMVVARKRT